MSMPAWLHALINRVTDAAEAEETATVNAVQAKQNFHGASRQKATDSIAWGRAELAYDRGISPKADAEEERAISSNKAVLRTQAIASAAVDEEHAATRERDAAREELRAGKDRWIKECRLDCRSQWSEELQRHAAVTRRIRGQAASCGERSVLGSIDGGQLRWHGKNVYAVVKRHRDRDAEISEVIRAVEDELRAN